MHELRENMRALGNGYRDWLERSMGTHSMTLPQFRLLYAVEHEGDSSSAAIARLCQVTPQTLSTMLQRAEREGWVVRRPAPHNARILTAALTPRGKSLLNRTMENVYALDALIWRDVPLREMRAINDALTKVRRRMKQQTSA